MTFVQSCPPRRAAAAERRAAPLLPRGGHGNPAGAFPSHPAVDLRLDLLIPSAWKAWTVAAAISAGGNHEMIPAGSKRRNLTKEDWMPDLIYLFGPILG